MRLHSPREILDAIFYIFKSGCAWRLLPYDFPPW
ncbi:MAG: transposase [Rubrobacter sp.]|nr:transposase [Rubrobacter sp.]